MRPESRREFARSALLFDDVCSNEMILLTHRCLWAVEIDCGFSFNHVSESRITSFLGKQSLIVDSIDGVGSEGSST